MPRKHFPLGYNGVNIDWLKDPAICNLYLNGRCKDNNSCPLAHDTHGKPYMWQYKSDGQSFWQSFTTSLNDSIEQCFAEPANESFVGR